MAVLPVRLSERALRTADQPIGYFMQQAVENPNLISLAAGLVDPGSLPAAEVAEAVADLLGQPTSAQAALQYGTTQGFGPLREHLLARTCALDRVSPQDVSLTPDDVVVTTGSQQLLYLLSELLLNPGDLVITEAPSYFVYEGTLESQGVRTLAVPMDDDGMDTAALEELLTRLERTGEIGRLRFIYVCDYFQNPSGRTLSLPRRRHLLDLVEGFGRKQRILVLEDAAYRELRFEGDDLPSIKSLDRDNRHVIQALTFSKPCAPGLKTGYGFLPRELMAPLLRLKGNHDFGSNNFTQHVLNRLIESGAYDRHVAELRQVYRRKRDVTLRALEREFGRPAASNGADGARKVAGVRWTHPRGGMYVWLAFPPDTDTGPNGALMRAALREGVLYVPGQFCYLDNGEHAIPTCEARLCFGVVSVEKIDEAIRRLARAYRRATATSPAAVAGAR
jgi:2-aminoadipate transaminase